MHISRYKVNIQKSIACLYTRNEQVKFKLKALPFTLAPKNKILRYKSNKRDIIRMETIKL